MPVRELADRIVSNAVKETRPWQEDEHCRAIAPVADEKDCPYPL